MVYDLKRVYSRTAGEDEYWGLGLFLKKPELVKRINCLQVEYILL
jgi:hypothetical protein